MKSINKLLAVGLICLLAGCAAGAQTENMIVTSSDSTGAIYDKALKQSVSVAEVNGGKATNPAWTSEIGNEEFSEAIKSSLSSVGMLSDDGRYQLTANLVSVDQPLVGISLTVTTHVKYILEDTKTNKVILEKMLVTPYTATMGDSMLAVKRLQMANEGAGQKNIEALIQELSALNISGQKISVK